MQSIDRPLEVQKAEFKQGKLLATPIAGMIAWFATFISGLLFNDQITVWVLFISTGSIVYLGMGISKLTGENFLDKTKPKNTFNTLFFYTAAQAILVYSIAIPFFIENYSSLPLTVGILTGLMWLPMSWIIDHWVGIFHALLRTISILVLWYLFPDERFIVIPLNIVVIYVITIAILIRRYRNKNIDTVTT
ncbi:MAG: hypothetical protein IR153_00485 [Flavobacterium sp.]|nr:hypothetical protein [Flavobacterium sp.]